MGSGIRADPTPTGFRSASAACVAPVLPRDVAPVERVEHVGFGEVVVQQMHVRSERESGVGVSQVPGRLRRVPAPSVLPGGKPVQRRHSQSSRRPRRRTRPARLRHREAPLGRCPVAPPRPRLRDRARPHPVREGTSAHCGSVSPQMLREDESVWMTYAHVVLDRTEVDYEALLGASDTKTGTSAGRLAEPFRRVGANGPHPT